MNTDKCIKTISGIVEGYLSCGLIPDNELFHFIHSSYGLTDHDEIIEFINNGYDSGAVIDLLSYPSDTLRKSVERHVPDGGIPFEKLKAFNNTPGFPGSYYILLDEKKFYLSQQDSLLCIDKFIQRLNINLDFTYLSDLKETLTDPDIFDIRVLLRKRKFISGNDNCSFLRNLIAGYGSMGKSSVELFDLVNTACDFLDNSDRNPLDILSEKREYYKNAFMEAQEFAKLLKHYSMEFIMMQRIQPPLITAEEALSMMEKIFRLSSIAHVSGGYSFNSL